MAFYISLNEATKQLCYELEKNNFLDKIKVPRYDYTQQVLIEYIRTSYTILYGVKCVKGEKIFNKSEVISRKFFPLGYTHIYKWKIDYLCNKQCKCNSKPCLEPRGMDLNSILSFNNDLIYTDVSIKRKDFDFLKNNVMTYFKELFPKEVDKLKKFSIIGFIKSALSRKSKKE